MMRQSRASASRPGVISGSPLFVVGLSFERFCDRAMLKEHPIFVRVTSLLLSLLAALAFAAEPRQLSVYAPQTRYQVDILQRDGVDYVGLTDLLEPLGRLESHVTGKKLTLSFNGGEAEFQDGKRQVRAGTNSKLEMSANFLLLDGRGYIPAASIAQLLPSIAAQTAEFHAASGRLFVGSVQIRFSAELRHSPSRLVLSFPSPVNPSTLIEKGRVRLLFRHEPLVSNGNDNVSYGDPFLLNTTFRELPGGAEFVASLGQPATVSIADGGRTLTIATAVPPSAAGTPSAASPAVASSANTANPAAGEPAPAQRVRPFVILDAAHGGSESGAALSPTLQEKTVNLALARRLQKELEARGIPVVLTRVADNALTGDQRAVSANTSQASLYVALHSSAIGHGVRVYTAMLPPEPPGQVAGARSFLPWELAQSPYLAKSGAAAATLAAGCDAQGVPVRSSAVPLRPLNSVTLAAVAVEVAPLGSSAEELATPEYQQKIAAALASGIAVLRLQTEAQP
jgi:N-acetylmuramoyl-L-alanine amidase